MEWVCCSVHVVRGERVRERGGGEEREGLIEFHRLLKTSLRSKRDCLAIININKLKSSLISRGKERQRERIRDVI